MLSVVLLLGVGELAVEVAGCSAVFKGLGFIVCITTMVAEAGTACATLERTAGVGVSVAWMSGLGEGEVEVSSKPGVVEDGVGGGTGAFLFLCWLSEPRAI